MSFPSSPQSSQSLSAASTPSASRQKSPIELTPRSKIRGLLADLDSESEVESRDKNDSSKQSITTSKNASSAKLLPFSNDSNSDEDEDDVPVIPRGRLAGRMQAFTTSKQDDDDESDDADVYSRVKKQLMSRKTAQSKTSVQKAPTQEDDEPNSDADGDLYTASPRKEPRSRNSETPGLFVSPSKPSQARDHNSDSDDSLMENPYSKSRLQELVARKRAERKATEAEEKKKASEARKRRKEIDEMMRSGGTAETDSDREEINAARRLTQQSRPTRKASKKALEEMNRETQRMSRNMQLAHQAKTKKKYGTADLFKKFGFRQENKADSQMPAVVEASSDVEAGKESDTPPSSPPSHEDPQKLVMSGALPAGSIVDTQSATQAVNSKKDQQKLAGQSTATLSANLGSFGGQAAKPKTTRVRLPISTTNLPQEIDLSSDEELEVAPVQPSRLPIFDRMPAKKAADPDSLVALRALAHLTSPSKHRKSKQTSLTPSELQLILQRRARKQAEFERDERIAELKAKGIFIETEEERERGQLELENMLEKARKEAMELSKKEKDARKANGETENTIDISSDEDEEYEASEDEDEGGVELSGSEDEDEPGEDIEMEDEEPAPNPLLNDEADESEQENDDLTNQDEQPSEVEMGETTKIRSPPNRFVSRKSRVVIDDEDEEDVQADGLLPSAEISQPSAVEALAFGFDKLPESSLGLTQLFAGSMTNVQTQNDLPKDTQEAEQDSLGFLRGLPVSSIPDFNATMMEASQDIHICDSQQPASQAQVETQRVDLGLTQLQIQSQAMTQASEAPDPTQDAGFQISRTPAKNHRVPHSTVDTVVLPIPESPVENKKKGRLVRRSEVAAALSDIDDDMVAAVASDQDDEFEIKADAFNVMRKASKQKPAAPEFDKKKSNAKGMFDEQAEESEDEYAGLGGASDDDSDKEMEQELKEMIDENHVEVDERKIAALFADKERADDEKRIDKLYKDLTTGALRRKRGGDLEDLSDDDDEAEERRRRKQREFAKMRKALLEDENVGKIATNPKKMAFLRAIEDRDEEDMDFLEVVEEDEPDSTNSQSQEAQTESHEAQEAASQTADSQPKRKFEAENTENIPPFKHPRRSMAQDTAPKKARTLAEVRESVSLLLEEPHLIPDSQVLAEESDDEYFIPQPRNTAIVDRLTAKRVAASAEAHDASGNVAFHTSSAAALGFKGPSLLRRTATNLSSASTSSTGSTTYSTTSSTSNGTGVRMGGSKKSSIHYQARESERRAVIDAAEKRKKDSLRKTARNVGGRSVLGMLGNGHGGFE